MSALGQKQTFAVQTIMSALPPIADMCGATRDVRFVPIADIRYLIEMSALQHHERYRRRGPSGHRGTFA
jgi:hypothetical protein